MERDLNLMPGLKLAGCVLLIIGAVGFLAYPVTYAIHSVTSSMSRNGPIEFVGKVVDPQGNPLSGVTISAAVATYGIFRGHYQRQFDLETDADGLFLIKARKGSSLRLSNFSKTGFSIRGRPAEFKGLGVDTLVHWKFDFNPTSRERSITSREEPFTFIMEPASSP